MSRKQAIKRDGRLQKGLSHAQSFDVEDFDDLMTNQDNEQATTLVRETSSFSLGANHVATSEEIEERLRRIDALRDQFHQEGIWDGGAVVKKGKAAKKLRDARALRGSRDQPSITVENSKKAFVFSSKEFWLELRARVNGRTVEEEEEEIQVARGKANEIISKVASH